MSVVTITPTTAQPLPTALLTNPVSFIWIISILLSCTVGYFLQVHTYCPYTLNLNISWLSQVVSVHYFCNAHKEPDWCTHQESNQYARKNPHECANWCTHTGSRFRFVGTDFSGREVVFGTSTNNRFDIKQCHDSAEVWSGQVNDWVLVPKSMSFKHGRGRPSGATYLQDIDFLVRPDSECSQVTADWNRGKSYLNYKYLVILYGWLLLQLYTYWPYVSVLFEQLLLAASSCSICHLAETQGGFQHAQTTKAKLL